MVEVGDLMAPISWLYPGCDCPVYDKESGKLKGYIRVSSVDLETNTIYLETTE